MHELKHLWYSEKCEAIKASVETFPNKTEFHEKYTHMRKRRIFYEKEDGLIVQVSFVSDSPENITQWDDIQYLGVGTYHHTEFV